MPADTSAPESEVQAPAKKKSKGKIIGIVVAVIVVVAAILCAVFFAQGSSKDLEEEKIVDNLFDDELLAVKSDDKWQYIDKTGKVAFVADYDTVYPFSEGLALVVDENKDGEDKYGFIDKTGKLVVPFIYDKADSFHNGMALVVKYNDKNDEYKYGYVDKTGKVVIPVQYDFFSELSKEHSSVYDFINGEAVYTVKSEKEGFSCGVINTKNEILINPKYNYVSPFADEKGRRIVANYKFDDSDYDYDDDYDEDDIEIKSGMINKDGSVCIPVQFDDYMTPFKDGIAVVKTGDKYGYIKEDGKFLINPQYSAADEFDDKGMAVVAVDEKYGIINQKGEFVIPAQFDVIGGASDDGKLINVELNDKWGVINMKGEYVINLQYDFIGAFREGLANVRLDDKYGFINAKNEMVIPLQFDDAIGFKDGKAMVSVGDSYGIIDKEGKYILNPTYEYIGTITSAKQDLVKITVDDKDGYMNSKNEVVITPMYHHGLKFFSDGYTIALNDAKKWQVIDSTGKSINAAGFDDVAHFAEFTVRFNDEVVDMNKTLRLLGPICQEEDCYEYAFYDNDTHCAEHKEKIYSSRYCKYYNCYNYALYGKDYCERHSYLEDY